MHFGSIRTTGATSRYPGRTRFPAGSSLTHCADWSDALVAIESSGAAKKPLCDSVEKCFIQCIAPIRHCHHFIYPTQDNHRFIRWSSLTWGPTKCTIYSGACSGNPPAEQLVSTIESSMVPIYFCEAGSPTVSVGWSPEESATSISSIFLWFLHVVFPWIIEVVLLIQSLCGNTISWHATHQLFFSLVCFS
jgi:hypothetical protein